jgi:DNA ligase (NAD+)
MNRQQHLEEQIRMASVAYENGAPMMTDAQFDALLAELGTIAPSSHILRVVGAGSTGTVKHATPMLSLAKCHSVEDLTKWAKQLERTLNEHAVTLVVTPKYDGVACSLHYVGGHLARAATRGDGTTGEDITHVVQRMPTVPKLVPTGGDFEVRGEIVIHRRAFAERFASTYANGRNLVAGVLGRSDVDDSVAPWMTFIAYDAHRMLGDSLVQRLGALAAQFTVAHAMYSSVIGLKDTIAAATLEIPALDVETDGIVVRVDSYAHLAALGYTSHHPLGAIALKWKANSDETVLRSVEWNTSRTGTVIPVAVFDAVKLDGVSITRATLHHASNARMYSIGARIVVSRRGGVIPHVERVVAHTGGEACSGPTHCPECRSSLAWNAPHIVCSFPRCGAIVRGRIEHWCRSLGMDGVGSEVVAALFDWCGVDSFAELYELTPGCLNGARGWGEKKEAHLLAEIDRTRTMTTAQFITAIGADGVGSTTADAIAAKFTVDELRTLHSAIVVENVDGVGELTARRLIAAMRSPEIAQVLARVTVYDPTANIAPTIAAMRGDLPLAGRGFVFTGELTGMTRAEAQAGVRELGASTPNSVTRACTDLVVAPNAGATKAAAAQKRGIRTMNEAEFFALLAGHA